jgi:hypothetical protein
VLDSESLNSRQNEALDAWLQVGVGFAFSDVEGEADMRSDLTEGAYRPQQRPKMEARREIGHYIVPAAALLCVAIGVALYGQSGDSKYLLTSPGGIAFSDFRGYEDWPLVSSASTEEVLKVIVANPTMVAAYRAGVPNGGHVFPENSRIVKLQWKPKKSTEAPFKVDVPEAFQQAFVMEKDSKKFPKTGGWGYAVFNYDAATGRFTADPSSPVDCGHSCHVAVRAKDYIFHPYQKR